MLVIRAELQKVLFRIANWEDPVQSSLSWVCTSYRGLLQALEGLKIYEWKKLGEKRSTSEIKWL